MIQCDPTTRDTLDRNCNTIVSRDPVYLEQMRCDAIISSSWYELKQHVGYDTMLYNTTLRLKHVNCVCALPVGRGPQGGWARGLQGAPSGVSPPPPSNGGPLEWPPRCPCAAPPGRRRPAGRIGSDPAPRASRPSWTEPAASEERPRPRRTPWHARGAAGPTSSPSRWLVRFGLLIWRFVAWRIATWPAEGETSAVKIAGTLSGPDRPNAGLGRTFPSRLYLNRGRIPTRTPPP